MRRIFPVLALGLSPFTAFAQNNADFQKLLPSAENLRALQQRALNPDGMARLLKKVHTPPKITNGDAQSAQTAAQSSAAE